MLHATEAKDANVLSIPRVRDAIRDTLPSGPGQRNRAVFELARHVKAIPELAHTDVGELKPIVQEWHKRARPHIRTQAFEETWADFIIGWDRVEYPADQPPLEWALAQARDHPPPDAQQYEGEEVRCLVGVCYHLASRRREGVFHLSARAAGALLGVHWMTAYRWLRLLRGDGVLALVEKGNAGGKAHRYRWTGSAVSSADVRDDADDDVPF